VYSWRVTLGSDAGKGDEAEMGSSERIMIVTSPGGLCWLGSTGGAVLDAIPDAMIACFSASRGDARQGGGA